MKLHRRIILPVPIDEDLVGTHSSPRLSWPIYHDLARLLSGWRDYVKALGPEPFLLLLILQGLRMESREKNSFKYRDIEAALDISPATFRRWLHSLKAAGILTLESVPGTDKAEASFRIRLDDLPGRRSRHASAPVPGRRRPQRPSRRSRRPSRGTLAGKRTPPVRRRRRRGSR